jgi:hypothetical protein
MSIYRAKGPTPIYNTPYPLFEKDRNGLVKSIEAIAFPDTKFKLHNTHSSGVHEVITADYPSKTPLYVDNRFLISADEQTPEREKKLPPIADILQFMQSIVGVRYFWGGNWAEGIAEMSDLYPHLEITEDLLCKGVDCSGLLYQATNGFTPRNTLQLCTYGEELEVDKDTPLNILKVVKPLDMMVWRGHVLFVLDETHCIESVFGQGVIISDFIERYTYFRDRLKQENKPFSIRRWV